jgi:hypothetical protein
MLLTQLLRYAIEQDQAYFARLLEQLKIKKASKLKIA